MKIRRKEIIREVICEKAKKRDFRIEWGTQSSRRWDIASFTRDGVGQMFGIVEFARKPGMIFLDGIYPQNPIFKYDPEDENSYRGAIEEMELFMESEGYKVLDELKKQHVIQKEDRDYVFENMKDLSNHFRETNGIGDIGLLEAIKLIAKSIVKLQGNDWEDKKNELYEIVGFYIDTLSKIPSLQVVRRPLGDNSDIQDEKSLDIRRKDDEYVNVPLLNDIVGEFYSKRSAEEIENIFIGDLNLLLSVDELKKYNLKVEQWKLFQSN